MGSTIIMMFLPCLLLALASSALGQMTECFEVTSAVCPDGDMVCDLGMTGGCWNGNYCMPQGSICPPACYSPLPSECSGTDIPCDMGMHGCMPEGSVCPPACYTPGPSMCASADIVCDMGYDDNGCWMGDYCMPAGSVCPTY